MLTQRHEFLVPASTCLPSPPEAAPTPWGCARTHCAGPLSMPAAFAAGLVMAQGPRPAPRAPIHVPLLTPRRPRGRWTATGMASEPVSSKLLGTGVRGRPTPTEPRVKHELVRARAEVQLGPPRPHSSPVEEDRHALHGHDHGLAVGGGGAGGGRSARADFLLPWNEAFGTVTYFV